MRVFSFILFSVFLIACNNAQKEEKIVSKHTVAFNSSVQSAMDSYHAMTEAFVNWDSNAVVSQAKDLQSKLDSIKLDEFKPEVRTTASGSLDLAKKELQSMALNNSITEKRHSLNSLTQDLYNFLNTVQYDEKKIYLHKCPMAFNDSIPADWLSESDSIRNPYLGLHHPEYGKAMIECGETKATIDFTGKK